MCEGAVLICSSLPSFCLSLFRHPFVAECKPNALLAELVAKCQAIVAQRGYGSYEDENEDTFQKKGQVCFSLNLFFLFFLFFLFSSSPLLALLLPIIYVACRIEVLLLLI